MKKVTLLCLFFLMSFVSKSQEIENILLAAKQDASKLTEAYINPVMKGLIYGMNSGWYHTAKVHKKFGFDISFGLNVTILPEKDELINLDNLGLTKVTYTSNTTPSILGEGDGTTIIVTESYEGQTATASFKMPSGISDDLPLKAVPTPAIQLGFGLPYDFDVMLRFVPKVGSGDVTGKLLGFGLKKELTSLFGPMDRLPLHVSVLAAYTSMNVDYAIDGTEFSGANQALGFKLNSYTVQAIGSLNFSIINFYAGIGYSGGDSTLNVAGQYDLEYAGGVRETVNDPLNLKFNTGGFKSTIGTRLSLGVFKIFADYTLQEYNNISAGIAFSFR